MPALLLPTDPARVGPYRLTARLGHGGMGTVYLAEDEGGRHVAVKVINRELAGDEGFQARFRREVTAARRVRRFCTAAVLDAEVGSDGVMSRDGEPPYVVTEYVEGPTLAAAVAERGPLRGGDLDALAVGIATALTAIHGAGIVHRDLKPANVLLSATGPRVIDFGIARALDAADGPTRTGQFVGTPAYTAPEVLNGGEVTRATDVFAWGCVVAFAGTGRAPFAGATVSEALYRISHEPPDLEGLDPALVEPVSAALAKDPAERPTPQDLLVRLTGHAAPALADPGRTAVDPGRTTVEPAPARPRRGRRPLVAGGAALLALGMALGAAGQARLGGGFRSKGKTPATAQAPTPGTPFFPRDGFDNDRGGWDGTGCGVYRDQSLQVSTETTDATEEYCPLPGERAVADGRTLHEVSVSFASGGSSGYAGLYVLNRENSDDEGSRYEAMLRWDGVLRLRKVVDDDPVRGAVRNVELPGFRAQQANRLQVEVDLTGHATGLRVWVNGRRVLEFTDSARPLRRGTDALAVHHADGADETSAAMARFDDFIITRLH